MNIKITYDWLLDYLQTDADPYEIQKYLSLSGPSVESVTPAGDDYVFDIEITSNRVDMASVFGIAQEARAILPLYGKKAALKNNPLKMYKFEDLQFKPESKKLYIKPFDRRLCSRFTAVVLSGIKIGKAPKFIRDRLILTGIQSINNVVDISNYLMISLGQPTHMFDYDKIKGRVMQLRESQKGEKLTTLDGKLFTLPGGDIVIEDEKELIDLCGIMGGANSAISDTTTNIVFFVQTYNKHKIRRTSMTTGQRTIAATYFEKGLDEERVEPTLVAGVEMLEKYAGAQLDSDLYDIYEKPYTPTKIKVYRSDIEKLMGVEIEPDRITSILRNLGFGVEMKKNTFTVTVPSYRKDDIAIKEDVAEEVARVFGYQNLPDALPPIAAVNQPKDIDLLFELQSKIKHLLQYRGFNEVMNFSMTSAETITKLDGDPKNNLAIKNAISEEIKYMRISLLPSLAKNIGDNLGKKDFLHIFEIAKVYLARPQDLPDEKFRLAIAATTDYFSLKGMVELILEYLNIKYSFGPGSHPLMNEGVQSALLIGNEKIGHVGLLKPVYREVTGIGKDIALAEIDLAPLITHYRQLPAYRPPTPYAVVKLDATLPFSRKHPFEEFRKQAFQKSPLLSGMEVVDTYGTKATVRFYFTDPSKNISEEEAKKELATIIKKTDEQTKAA